MSGASASKDGSRATATAGRKPYVRVMTEKRREQNRRSQKAYRERLKKRHEGLEELEEQIKAKTLEVSFADADSALQEPLGHLYEDEAEVEDSPAVLQSRIHLHDNPAASSVIDLEEAFELDGDIPLPPTQPSLPVLNIAIRPRTPTPAVPPHSSSQWIVARQPWPTFSQIQPPPASSPRDESTDTLAGCPTTPAAPVASWPGFSLHANFLRLQSENCLAACLAIAATLGITQESYINDDPSPFYPSSCAFDSGYLASGSEFGVTPQAYLESPTVTDDVTPSRHPFHPFARIKPDLRPSKTQLETPHPSYLDCIIFPSFRDRAIELSAIDKLDHWDLFWDIINDGLVCWGSANKSGMENGVAWSMRSWEARPWFLKKWWFLAGGEDEEVWQGSRWWWSMRGEDLGVDDVLFRECKEL